MVTLLTPVKRVVSIRATTAVSSPGLRYERRAVALVQPQETRTLLMLTGPPVLLTTRKGWTKVGPRGTEPKSLLSSSKRPSAQEAAAAGPAAHRPARRTKPYRNMVPVSAARPGPAGCP